MRIATVVLISVAAVLGGCSGTDKAPSSNAAPSATAAVAAKATNELNDVCPITGDTVEPKFSAEYQGRKIGFCCEHCVREFRDADDAAKAAIVAKAFPGTK